jgi:protein disulfide-isomerase
MKRIMSGLVVVVVWLALGLAAQVRAAEGEWMTDFQKAQSKASAERKMVLVDFTGSDWCPPCMELEKKVLSSDEFKNFAKDHLVLVRADFPQHTELTQEQKKANESLSEKFNVEGFPTILVLSSEGKQLSKEVGYGGESAKDFVKKLEKLQEKDQTKGK